MSLKGLINFSIPQAKNEARLTQMYGLLEMLTMVIFIKLKYGLTVWMNIDHVVTYQPILLMQHYLNILREWAVLVAQNVSLHTMNT